MTHQTKNTIPRQGVYLIRRIPGSLFKIGQTKNLKDRLRLLRSSGGPEALEVIDFIDILDPYNRQRVEKYLFSLLTAYRIGRREWFHLPYDDNPAVWLQAKQDARLYLLTLQKGSRLTRSQSVPARLTISTVQSERLNIEPKTVDSFPIVDSLVISPETILSSRATCMIKKATSQARQSLLNRLLSG